MNAFILISSLLSVSTLLCKTPPTIWDTIRTAAYDELDTAEYYLDQYPTPTPHLKDKIWLLMRNGFRNTAQTYKTNQSKYGKPTCDNAMDIIESNIGEQERWARVFAKAVAKNVNPIIDDTLYAQRAAARKYQQEALECARARYEPDEQLDPE